MDKKPRRNLKTCSPRLIPRWRHLDDRTVDQFSLAVDFVAHRGLARAGKCLRVLWQSHPVFSSGRAAETLCDCHHALGTLYSHTRQVVAARAELSTAIDLYRSMHMTFWLPAAEAALARVA
jgi:hypothetical protein